MNTQKMIMAGLMACLLSATVAFAKEAPCCPATLELTSQQWEMLKTMKPEQQKMAFSRGVNQQLAREKMAKLTPEQQAEVEDFIKTEKEHRKAMKDRLDKMTKEQKEVIRLQLPKPPKREFKGGPKNGHHFKPGPDCKGRPCPPPAPAN